MVANPRRELKMKKKIHTLIVAGILVVAGNPGEIDTIPAYAMVFFTLET